MVGFQIDIVATIDGTAEIGSKKSIKSRFKSDLDPILAGGRSNCISLVGWQMHVQYQPLPPV